MATRVNDRRNPAVLPGRQALQRQNFALQAIRARLIGLVDDEDVGDLHDAGFDGLHIVAHAGNQHDHGHVREFRDLHFILADADSFDEDNFFAGGVEQQRHVGGCRGEAAQDGRAWPWSG